jgi:hypothetical protein
MPQSDEIVRHTREDLIQALADELGSTPGDARVHDAYEQVVDELAEVSFDPGSIYSRYFGEGAIASDLDLAAIRGWAKGRLLLD